MATGSPLATAFVRLRLDTTGLQADAERQMGSADLTGAGTAAGKRIGDGLQAGVAQPLGQISTRGKAAFSQMANIAGQSGAFSPLSGALRVVGEGLDFVTTNGRRAGTVLIGAGTAAAAAGALLVAASRKDVEAHAQLKVAIENSGHSYDDYAKRVDEAIKHQERFGHTADDTQDALRKLTDATGDPTVAIERMGLVADLAASRHISLADAAGLVAKVLNGTGGKALAGYGIHIDATKDKTSEANRALDEWSHKLSGQAAASADTFSGKLDAAGTRLKDFISTVGGKLGPALTVAGTALGAVGSLIEIGGAVRGALAARALASANTQLAASAGEVAVGEQAAAVATAEATAAANAATGANERAAVAGARFGSVAGKAAVGLGALAVAAGAAAAVNWAGNWASAKFGEHAADVDKLSTALKHLGETDNVGGELAKSFGDSQGLGKALKQVADPSMLDRLKSLDVRLLTIGKYNPAAQLAKFGPLNDFKVSSENVKKLDTALAGLVAGGNIDTARGAFTQIAAAAAEQGVSVEKLRKKYPLYAAALDAADAATGTAADSSTRLGHALQVVADAVGKVGRQFNVLSKNESLDTALIANSDAAAALTKSIKDNGRAFDTTTVKGKANTAAFIGAAKSAQDLRQAYIDSSRGAGAADIAYNKAVAALRASAIAAGIPIPVLDRLLGRYTTLANTPDIRIGVGISGERETELALLRVQRAVQAAGLVGVHVSVTAGDPSQSSQHGHAASGGRVRAGQSYVVGEVRRELFTPDSDGTITPEVPYGGGSADIVAALQSMSWQVRLDPQGLATIVATGNRANGRRG